MSLIHRTWMQQNVLSCRSWTRAAGGECVSSSGPYLTESWPLMLSHAVSLHPPNPQNGGWASQIPNCSVRVWIPRLRVKHDIFKKKRWILTVSRYWFARKRDQRGAVVSHWSGRLDFRDFEHIAKICACSHTICVCVLEASFIRSRHSREYVCRGLVISSSLWGFVGAVMG